MAMGSFGLLAARIGPGPHLRFVPSLPGNVDPDEFTYFHEGIAHEEMSRCLRLLLVDFRTQFVHVCHATASLTIAAGSRVVV